MRTFNLKKRSLLCYAASLLFGSLLGVLYYWASWQYHLFYLGFNWLGPLIGAVGERGYDAMLYESAIDFGLGALSLFLLVKKSASIRRHV